MPFGRRGQRRRRVLGCRHSIRSFFPQTRTVLTLTSSGPLAYNFHEALLTPSACGSTIAPRGAAQRGFGAFHGLGLGGGGGGTDAGASEGQAGWGRRGSSRLHEWMRQAVFSSAGAACSLFPVRPSPRDKARPGLPSRFFRPSWHQCTLKAQ